MFQGEKEAKVKAEKIADYLTNEKNTLSHARRIDARQLSTLGVKVEFLEEQDKNVQDAIRQLHLAIMTTLDGTSAVKIFENSKGDALIRAVSIATPEPKQKQERK